MRAVPNVLSVKSTLAFGLLTAGFITFGAPQTAQSNPINLDHLHRLGVLNMSTEQVEFQCAKYKADLASLWEQTGSLDHDIRESRLRLEKDAAQIANSVPGFGEFYSHYLLESRTLRAHSMSQHVRSLPSNSALVVGQILEKIKSEAESLVYSKGSRSAPLFMACGLQPKSLERALRDANPKMATSAHHYLLSTRYLNQALGLPASASPVEKPLACLNAVNSALTTLKQISNIEELADLFIQKWVAEELKKSEGTFKETIQGSAVLEIESQCRRFVSCHKFSDVVAATMESLKSMKKSREELERMMLLNDALDKRLLSVYDDIEVMSSFVAWRIKKSKNPTRASTCVNEMKLRY